jgi:DNA-binding transcriptional LysR family regulator
MGLEELLSAPIRLRHVYVASAIADRGSVRDASELLYLTQPATSRTLRELEDALGVVLFDRTAKGMVATEAGRALAPHLQLIASEVGALLRHAAEIRSGEGGQVRVGTVLAGSGRLLPDAVMAVKKQDADVKVRIDEATPVALHDRLLRGELDLLVGRTLPIASLPGVEVEVLHDDSVNVVAGAGHPLADGSELRDLVDEQWVLPPAETSLRQQVDAAFVRDAGRAPTDVVECVAPVPTRRMLIHGPRLGVVPAGVFVDDIDGGQLMRLPIDIAGTSVPVGIITRAGGDLPPSAHKLMDALRAVSLELYGPAVEC